MLRFIALLLVIAAVLLPAWPETAPGRLASGFPDKEGRFLFEGRVRPDGGDGSEESAIPVEVSFSLGRCDVEFELGVPIDAGTAEQACWWEERIVGTDGTTGATQSGRVEGERTGVRVLEAEGRATGSPSSFLLARGPFIRGGCRKGKVSSRAEYLLQFRARGRAYRLSLVALNLQFTDRKLLILDGHE